MATDPSRRLRRLRRLAGLATGLALTAGVAAAAPSVQAQAGTDAARPLVIRSVDASAYPVVSMVVTAPVETALEVTQNGTDVGALGRDTLEAGGVPRATVIVVDTSSAMADRDAMDLTRLGLTQLVQGQAPGERIGLVTFGVSGRAVVPPTTDRATVLAAINDLTPATRDEASRSEGLREATDLVRDLRVRQPGLLTDVVLVSASRDRSSTVTESAAIGSLLSVHAVVHAIGIDFGELDASALRRLGAATPGGDATIVDEPSGLVSAIAGARQRIDAQTAVSYTATEDARALEIDVKAGEETARAMVNPGQLAQGADLDPSPVTLALGKGPSFLRDANAKWLVLMLGLAAFVLLAYGVFLLLVRDTTNLDQVLRHYDDTPVDVDLDEVGHGAMVESKLLQRAVAITSKLAEQQGLLTKVERALERADLPLRPAEALLFYGATVVVGGALSVVLTGSLLFGLAGAVVVGLIPPGIVNLKAGRRKAKFQSTLPDMLQLLAGSLRAGYSLMQGVEAVSREVEEPMGKELRRVIVEARLGRPLEEALDDVAVRMGSADFAWAVMAIGIQREVGGNLAELLMTVSDTMTHRERMRRDVKSLTAEGRVSAVVLAILPPALAGAMYTVNPDYISVLFTDSTGNMMLGLSTLLAVGGFIWMKKLAKVEV